METRKIEISLLAAVRELTIQADNCISDAQFNVHDNETCNAKLEQAEMCLEAAVLLKQLIIEIKSKNA